MSSDIEKKVGLTKKGMKKFTGGLSSKVFSQAVDDVVNTVKAKSLQTDASSSGLKGGSGGGIRVHKIK